MPIKAPPTQKPDRRIRRTLESLANALIELTLEKGYDAVTIRDITARAQVGYATFFRHYADKEGLLNDVIEVVLTQLMGFLQNTETDDSEGYEGMRLFQYVEENSSLCRVLVSSGMLQRVQAAGVRYVLTQRTPRKNSPIPPEIAANHLVAASVALIQWWLINGMPYPPKRMGQIFQDLIIKPTQPVAFTKERKTG